MSSQYIEQGLKIYTDHKNDKNLGRMIIKFTRVYHKDLKPSTMLSALSKLKRRIIDDYNDNSIQIIKFPKKEYQAVNLERDKNLQDRANEGIEIDNGQMFMAAVLSRFDMQRTFANLFPALALATGRRVSELLFSASLTPVAENEYAAMFSGQLKKGSSPSVSYEIPLLARYSVVNKALEDIQSMAASHPQYTHATTLGGYVKKVTDGLASEPLHVHSLRGIYGTLAYQINKPKSSVNAYFAKVLGHADLTTSVSYNIYKIHGDLTRWGIDYRSMTVAKLKELAGKKAIVGRSTMNKSQLIGALNNIHI